MILSWTLRHSSDRITSNLDSKNRFLRLIQALGKAKWPLKRFELFVNYSGRASNGEFLQLLADQLDWPIEILNLEQLHMLAQVLQIYWGKEHLVKNWLISTLDNVIYFKGTIFQRSTKPLFILQNRVDMSWKNDPFFKHASSSIAPKISMDWPFK
jgi:hypothetical protein